MFLSKKHVPVGRDFFRNFKCSCKLSCGNYPLCVHSTPSFSWKAGLIYTGVKIKCIVDDGVRLKLQILHLLKATLCEMT